MKRSPMKRRPKKVSAEERKYAAWIRKQRCTTGLLVCSRRRAEAAHTGGHKAGAGMAIKSDHEGLVPLCAWCHRLGPMSYHAIGEEKFCEAWGIDLPKVTKRLRREYEENRQ